MEDNYDFAHWVSRDPRGEFNAPDIPVRGTFNYAECYSTATKTGCVEGALGGDKGLENIPDSEHLDTFPPIIDCHDEHYVYTPDDESNLPYSVYRQLEKYNETGSLCRKSKLNINIAPVRK